MEVETFGVTYERYALLMAQKKLVKKYKIHSVLEIPAHGVKAAPSLYSLGFALAKCLVTLVNPDKNSSKIWQELGLEKTTKTKRIKDLTKTNFPDNSFDLVWNFIYLPLAENPEILIEEMKRISKKYVLIVSVNALNPGFTIHRTLHKVLKIPWTHGNIKFNSILRTKKFLKTQGLKLREIGLLGTPPWPDSLGFRDVKLHRSGIDKKKLKWKVPITEYIKTNNYPTWIKSIYFWERLPVPFFLKVFYSHLFYILGEK